MRLDRLSYVQINNALKELDAFLDEKKYSRDMHVRLHLSLEDSLLAILKHFGEDTAVLVSTKNRLPRPKIDIEFRGECFNPLTYEFDEGDGNFHEILSEVGLAPKHTYVNGVNHLQYLLPSFHLNMTQRLLSSVLLALVLGLSIHAFGTEKLAAGISEGILSPIVSIFLGLLGTLSLPLMFFSALYGITGVGDRRTLGSISGKLLYQFLGHTFYFLIFVAFFGCLFFGVVPAVQGGTVENAGVTGLIQNFFPTNIITPFIDGKCTQVVLIAVAIGIAVLVLDNQAYQLRTLIEELRNLFMTLMSWLGSLIPLFLFALITKMILSDSFMVVLDGWRFLLLFFVFMLLLNGFLVICVSRSLRIPLVQVIRNMSKSILTATTTMSTLASVSAMMEEGVSRFHISPKLVNIASPLGAILSRHFNCTCIMLYSLFFINFYGIEITWPGMTVLILSIFIMSLAIPSVAGGTLAVITMIFTIVGIPLEAVGVVALLDTITDLFTAFSVTSIQLETVLMAKKLDMIDDTASA